MKTWLLVLMTVIATGGLVGGGTYYYFNKKANRDTATLQTQLDELKAPAAATTVVDETADWKTYVNTTYGYSIKYPTNFDSSVTDNGASFFNVGSDKTNWIISMGKVDLMAVREIEIGGVLEKARSVTFEQFVSNDLPGQGTSKIENVKKISVDPGIVYLVTYSGQTMKGDALTSYYAYYDLGNNQYLMMMLNGSVNLAIFEKMLPTFKFDETADAPTVSKTPATSTDVFSLANLKVTSVTISGTSYKLTNGTYTHPGTGPFENGVPETIVLDESHIAVDSANADQAAIILQIHARLGGGNATFNELEIMNNVSGTPTYVARVALNNNEQSTIDSVAFASNIVTVHMTVSGVAVTASYKLSGTTLIKQ